MNAKLNWVTLQGLMKQVLSLLLGLPGIGQPLWDLCECQVRLVNLVYTEMVIITTNHYQQHPGSILEILVRRWVDIREFAYLRLE